MLNQAKNTDHTTRAHQISIPLLPPSLNAYRRFHWREQRKTEAIWKKYIFVKWLELKRPTYEAVHIILHFYFPDKRLRDMDNYMATGSKLVGDAIKGCFIPDDSPQYLTCPPMPYEPCCSFLSPRIHLAEVLRKRIIWPWQAGGMELSVWHGSG